MFALEGRTVYKKDEKFSSFFAFFIILLYRRCAEACFFYLL